MDLSTTYLGLRLRSPLVPSASPLTRSLDNLPHMEDSGAGAVVLFSLFQEQVEFARGGLERSLVSLTGGALPPTETLAAFPMVRDERYRMAPEAYFEHLRRAKAAVSIPLIGSLNGVSPGDWLSCATGIEQAGSDALEVSLYDVPTDPSVAAAEIEQRHVDLVRDVTRRVGVPVAVKFSPSLTNVAHLARRLAEAGAQALVLFTRFYQPDLDVEALREVPRPTLSTLQTPEALRLPLRWISLLYGRVPLDLAGSGGVHVAQDVAGLVLAGASVAMLASELLQRGIDRLRPIRRELEQWMETHEYESLDDVRGRLSQRRVPFPSALERAAYLRVVADPVLAPATTRGGVRPTWQPEPSGRQGHLLGPDAPRPRLPHDDPGRGAPPE